MPFPCRIDHSRVTEEGEIGEQGKERDMRPGLGQGLSLMICH